LFNFKILTSLYALTSSNCLELADKKVRVNSVNPGTVQTNIVKTSGVNDEDFNKVLKLSIRSFII
jgi:NAD(P)-dependent dehydrogenase (short-subunit alcohol dehydrogenase family)